MISLGPLGEERTSPNLKFCELLRTPLPRTPVNRGLGPHAGVVPDLGDAFPAARSTIARSLPRCASRGLFQGLQGLRTIHARAPYEVNRRGVDLVDERVDAQTPR